MCQLEIVIEQRFFFFFILSVDMNLFFFCFLLLGFSPQSLAYCQVSSLSVSYARLNSAWGVYIRIRQRCFAYDEQFSSFVCFVPFSLGHISTHNILQIDIDIAQFQCLLSKDSFLLFAIHHDTALFFQSRLFLFVYLCSL